MFFYVFVLGKTGERLWGENVGRLLGQTHGGDAPGGPLGKSLSARYTVSVLKDALRDMQMARLQG